MITKGSKPVAYKSTLRLKFYSADVEDCRVAVTQIFAKLLPDGGVIVFGEYSVYLLFTYTASRGGKDYITESQHIRFSETVDCQLPAGFQLPADWGNGQQAGLFDTRAVFEPHIACKPGAGGAFTVEVEGEIDVFIYGEKNAASFYRPFTGFASQPLSGSATVVRIDNAGISANELLEMDTEAIKSGSVQKPVMPKDEIFDKNQSTTAVPI